MEILSEACDSQNRAVRYVPAFVKNQVAKPGSGLNYLLDTGILQLAAVREVKDAESVVGCFQWKAKEGLVGHAPTMSQTQFSQVRSFRDEGGDGIIFEVLAIVEVDLEDVAAVSSEGDDGLVGQLRASVEFELQTSEMLHCSCVIVSTNPLQVSAALRYSFQ